MSTPAIVALGDARRNAQRSLQERERQRDIHQRTYNEHQVEVVKLMAAIEDIDRALATLERSK